MDRCPVIFFSLSPKQTKYSAMNPKWPFNRMTKLTTVSNASKSSVISISPFFNKLSEKFPSEREGMKTKPLWLTKMLLQLCHTTLTWERTPSTLFVIISFRLQSAGRTLVLVDPGGTSRTCSGCGWVKSDLNLSDCIFHWGICGLEIDRDVRRLGGLTSGKWVKIGIYCEGCDGSWTYRQKEIFLGKG